MYSIGSSVNYQKAKIKTGFEKKLIESDEMLIEIAKTDFTPAIYQYGDRTGANFAYSDFLYADVDSGCSIEEFIEQNKKYNFYILTSRNHQKEKVSGKNTIPACDRFHVLFPVEKPFKTAFDLNKAFQVLRGRLPYIDKDAGPIGRFFFGNKNVQILHNEGSFYPITHVEPQNYSTFVTSVRQAKPDTDLIDNICTEEERDAIRAKLSVARDEGIFNGREDWIRIGLALKSLGFTYEDFKLVSFQDIAERDLQYRWDSFHSTGALSLGTIKFYLNKIGKKEEELTVEEDYEKLVLDQRGNADRFLNEYQDSVKYSRESNIFYIWNGKYWQNDNKENCLIGDLIGQSLRSLAQKADIFCAKWGNDKAYDKLCGRVQSFARSSQSFQSIKGIIGLLKSVPEIAQKESEFDNHPYLFNCANGTVDLRTSKLMAHDKKYLLSRISDVVYDEDATCCVFEDFMITIMCNDKKKIDFLLTWIAFCMTGLPAPRKTVFMLGDGRNGKSTLVNAISNVMGQYHISAAMSSFIKQTNKSAVRSDLYHMRGARLITAQESSAGEKLDEGLIKEFSGGDTIRARNLFALEEIEFKNNGKLIFSTNHKPTIGGGDNAIWDRIVLVTFEYEVPENMENYHLDDALKSEANGIFSMLLRYFKAFFEGGERFTYPESIKEAIAEYRNEEDRTAQFIEACLVKESQSETPMSAIYEAYKRHSVECGTAHPLALTNFARGFYRSAKSLGWNIDKKHTAKGSMVIGLALTPNTDRGEF